MKQRYSVTLQQPQRQQLQEMISAGTGSARTLAHARILLKADRGDQGPGWKDQDIAAALEVSCPTIGRVRQRFAREGLEAALHRRPPQRQYQRKLDGRQEAHLVAVACSAPPEGQGRWTLRLLANRMVELEQVDSLSYETVRRALKKTVSSPG
jgi:transposase